MRFLSDLTSLLASIGLVALVLPLAGCQQGQGNVTGNFAGDGTISRISTVSTGSTNAEPSGKLHLVQLSPEAQKLAGIEFGKVEERLLDFTVKTTGEVLANANLMTHVTTPVTGRIVEVLVSVGDRIEQGRPLMTIRSTDIEQSEADLLQNESQVRADLKRDLLQIDSDTATAQAQIKLSESTYNRIKNLVEEKIASRADFENARTQFEKDRINLEALKRKRDATVSLSRERMTLLTEPIKQKLKLLGVSDAGIAKVLRSREIDPIVPVLAPAAGIISERLVNVGELVDPTKPLFTIGDFHNVWIKADVYEKDVSKVKADQPIDLELDSFPGEKFRGKLNYVADSINPDTRTLAVRAEVPNPGLKLKPKMFARMNILVGAQRVLTIPKSAVQDAGSDKVVYVPAGNNRFQERTVKLGGESGDSVEVLSGLRAGEQIVCRGSFELRSESVRESG